MESSVLFLNYGRSPGDVADVECDVVCAGIFTLEVRTVEGIEVVEASAEADSPGVVGAELPFVAFIHRGSDSVGKVIDLGHRFRGCPVVEAADDAP